ncbi:MAG: hypothetical protein GX616_05150 [Planctomycetes bacterium]|nr:hypothetical protein [Planctomycetota bacterium]
MPASPWYILDEGLGLKLAWEYDNNCKRHRPTCSWPRPAMATHTASGPWGHLFEAEDESQEWPELHASIRDARTHYQAAGEMPDWQALDDLLSKVRRAIRSTAEA